MKLDTPAFIEAHNSLRRAIETYVRWSPSQITRGDHLKNDPKLGERAWSIPQTTGEFLFALIKTIGAESALELGTSIGYSTLWIAAGISENNANPRLLTIEKNEEKQNIAKLILDQMFPGIEFHTGRILDILPLISYRFDLIFMDADRGNYSDYWIYIKKLLYEKSIVVIDNALHDQDAVRDFQAVITTDPNLSTLLHPLDNGLLLIALANGDHNDLRSIVFHASQNMIHR